MTTTKCATVDLASGVLFGALGVMGLVGLVPQAQAQTQTQAQAQAQEPRVPVKQFIVTGNTLLPQEALDAALAPYKGERTLRSSSRLHWRCRPCTATQATAR